MRTSTSSVARTLPILTYHSLDDGASPISVAPAVFEAQMEHLARQGWRTLSLDRLLQGREDGGWPARTLVITFDDGLANFAQFALPVLRTLGFGALVFVVPDWVGRTNDWPGQPAWVPRQPLMAWDRLSGLPDAGIDVAAHSMTHRSLVGLEPDVYYHEIVTCRAVIEDRLGCSVRAFAYPYGDVGIEALGYVAEHYQVGFTTRLAYATPASSTAALERIDSYYLRHPYLFSALEAGWLRQYLALRRWIRRLRQSGRRSAS